MQDQGFLPASSKHRSNYKNPSSILQHLEMEASELEEDVVYMLSIKAFHWIQMSLWKNIPNPAHFFRLLYSDHNGNVQDWIRPQDAHIQVFKSEGDAVEKEQKELYPYSTTNSDPQEGQISHITDIQPLTKTGTSTDLPNSAPQQCADIDYVGVNESEMDLASYFIEDLFIPKPAQITSSSSQNNVCALKLDCIDLSHAIHLQAEKSP
ncbi:hypothetical protein NDU88_001393 [Pleurodeles waltl]|uniref:Uncharacterized protein n=1 Tax=Pleurodeles waltl TaxID=8319 RepID=A0AAV7M0D3_PLEWA|nr:hypothetical protein NDU88_001393 [Pleurodeles waltl]